MQICAMFHSTDNCYPSPRILSGICQHKEDITQREGVGVVVRRSGVVGGFFGGGVWFCFRTMRGRCNIMRKQKDAHVCLSCILHEDAEPSSYNADIWACYVPNPLRMGTSCLSAVTSNWFIMINKS